MKHLTLVILVALAPLSWGEEDNPFPVDLTCNISVIDFYLHLTGDKTTSWVEPITAEGAYIPPFREKHYGKKNFGVKTEILNDHLISIEVPMRQVAFDNVHSVGLLNRYTLKIEMGPRERKQGQCTLGFKEFGDRLL